MDHLTGNPQIDQWISLLGALVPVASMVAGILNQRIRDQGAGPFSPMMLNVVGLLNVFAVNFDKAAQLAKMAKEMRESMAAMNAAPEGTSAVDTQSADTQSAEAPKA